MKSITLRNVLSLFGAVLIASAAFAFGSDKTIVGKKGEVVFSQPHRWGDTTFPAGHYQIQHRVKEGQHFIHLVELKDVPRRAFTRCILG